MTSTGNREKLIELINSHDITRKQVANFIEVETKRPCSWRAVQSWVADPDKVSARTCPDWAIDALQSALQKWKINRK